jgi:hypothetical protein
MSSITGGCSIYRRMNRLAIGLLAMLVPFLFGSCTPPKAKQPHVPAFNNAALTSTLQRGVSNAADVKAALGEPNGSGGYLFPIVAEPHTIWFYEKMKVDVSGQELDVQQDVLLIFFKKGRFDGFLWFSDAHKEW